MDCCSVPREYVLSHLCSHDSPVLTIVEVFTHVPSLGFSATVPCQLLVTRRFHHVPAVLPLGLLVCFFVVMVLRFPVSLGTQYLKSIGQLSVTHLNAFRVGDTWL